MTSLWLPTPEPFPAPLYCNMGGPMSRTRNESLYSTLLGRDDSEIRCPRVIRLALEFSGQEAVASVERLLAAQSCVSPEQLRTRYAIPPKRLICRIDLAPDPIVVGSAPPECVLETALMLGLCTRVIYDPARPVLWTDASLSRRLELFDPEGFYA